MATTVRGKTDSSFENAESIVLAVDIGNTRTKLGVIDLENRTCRASTAFPTGEIAYKLLPAVTGVVASLPMQTIKTVALSSVVKHAALIAGQLLRQEGYSIRQLSADGVLPLSINYFPQDALGADRIANALYATTVFPGKTVVCISAGTAIVIDYIADRAFLGGTILPGVALQLDSLHLSTDALPAIECIDASAAAPFPGTSTESSIIAGVLHGTASAINGIVAKYSALKSDLQPLILTTGGDWPLLSQLVDFESIAISDLTLIGTACILIY